MKYTINNDNDVKKLVRNYRNFCGQNSIVCDIPLNALKSCAKILSNFKDENLFLREDKKDAEYLEKLQYHLARIKGGEGWKGYKRASLYISTIERVIKSIN